jgi:hypothetical protein
MMMTKCLLFMKKMMMIQIYLCKIQIKIFKLISNLIMIPLTKIFMAPILILLKRINLKRNYQMKKIRSLII